MKIDKDNESNHCGSKPKKIAFGIAPLGLISIGIVPMGVVSIGIVPMGVFSFGAVAMGIVNLSIVGMGIISSGITTMGVWEYSPRYRNHNHHNSEVLESPGVRDSLNRKMLFKTKREAEESSKNFNCKGAHRMGEFWMPCDKH